MNAFLGMLCLSAAAVLFAWSFAQIRRPNPRHWASSDFAAELLSLMCVALLAFGIGFTARFLMADDPSSLAWSDVGGMAAVVALGAIAVQVCMAGLRRARSRYAAAAVSRPTVAQAVVPTPANDAGADLPSPPLASGLRGKLRRRRAA